MSITIEIVQDATDLASCLAIRRVVFMDEQAVPEDDEIDGEDDHCTHIIAKVAGEPMGTARFQVKNGSVKIQRVCVLAAHRGHSYGANLIQFITNHVKSTGMSHRIYLGAQTQALDFYEKLGFTAFGPEYMDAGIPHRDMELRLDQA